MSDHVFIYYSYQLHINNATLLQVGKTTAVHMFSKSFDQYIYLNQYQGKTMENTTNTNHQSPKKQIARQGKMSPPEIESWMTYSWETKQQTPARLPWAGMLPSFQG